MKQLTAADLEGKLHMKVIMFGDGVDPKHIQISQCREHPCIGQIWVMNKDRSQSTTLTVDGKEIERGDGFFDRLAEALNEYYAEHPPAEEKPDAAQG